MGAVLTGLIVLTFAVWVVTLPQNLRSMMNNYSQAAASRMIAVALVVTTFAAWLNLAGHV